MSYRNLINSCLLFLRNGSGNILMEAALIFPILLVALAGIVEVSQFIQVKERINSISNQVANAISSSPIYNAVEINKIVLAGRGMALPFTPNIRVVMCKYNINDAANPSDNSVDLAYSYIGANGDGKCGFGSGPGITTADPVCETIATLPPGYPQQVKVRVGCRYHPLVNIFGIIGDGFVINSDISVPLRTAMLP